MLVASASAAADESATADVATSAPKAECVSHLDRAQLLHSARKLREARASYLACSTPACPELLREDCSRSLVELDSAIPTVVFSARADGHADSDADRLRSSCAPSCDQSSRDAFSDKLVVANVALGVGIGAVALAAATWLFDRRH